MSSVLLPSRPSSSSTSSEVLASPQQPETSLIFMAAHWYLKFIFSFSNTPFHKHNNGRSSLTLHQCLLSIEGSCTARCRWAGENSDWCQTAPRGFLPSSRHRCSGRCYVVSLLQGIPETKLQPAHSRTIVWMPRISLENSGDFNGIGFIPMSLQKSLRALFT
jgi:hypothetical protein